MSLKKYKHLIISPHLISQSSDTTLEEFLEELDALTDAEAEDQKDQDSKIKLSPSPDSLNTSEEVSESTDSVSAASSRKDTPTQGKTDAPSPRGSEKKVRFSEDLIQGAHTRQITSSQETASPASSPSSLKASTPNEMKCEVQGPQQPLESAKEDCCSPQDQGDGPFTPVAQQQASESECTKKDSTHPTAPSSPPVEKACASLQENSVQPVELAKCNISNTNTGMLWLQCLVFLTLHPDGILS